MAKNELQTIESDVVMAAVPGDEWGCLFTMRYAGFWDLLS